MHVLKILCPGSPDSGAVGHAFLHTLDSSSAASTGCGLRPAHHSRSRVFFTQAMPCPQGQEGTLCTPLSFLGMANGSLFSPASVARELHPKCSHSRSQIKILPSLPEVIIIPDSAPWSPFLKHLQALSQILMRRRGTLVGCRLTACAWGQGLEVEAPRMWFWELKRESGTQSESLEPSMGAWKPG